MQYVLKVTNIYKNILLHKEVAISVIFKMGDDFFFHCIKMVFTEPCKKISRVSKQADFDNQSSFKKKKINMETKLIN